MKISVVTSVYNNRETISDALESVASQSFDNIEHLVIDGASTDGTVDIIEGYLDQLAVFQSEPDKGIYDGLNKGVQRATGDVIGFLHSDDLFADSGVLARVAEAFEDPQIDAVYGDLIYTRKDNAEKVIRYWRSGEYSQAKLSRGWMPPHPSLYVRKAFYEELGLFDTSFRIAADYDFMLRLLTSESVQVRYIPHVLVKMRMGGASNQSLKSIVLKSKEDYRALKSNGVGGFLALAIKNLSKMQQFFISSPKAQK